MAQRAGHDINYISSPGAARDRPAGRPAGAAAEPRRRLRRRSMYLLVGVLAALLEASAPAAGQVVDAAIVDGASLLMQMTSALYGQRHGGRDGGGPTCSRRRGRTTTPTPARTTRHRRRRPAGAALTPSCSRAWAWTRRPARPERRRGPPVLREPFTAAFATRTRDEWAAVFGDTEACVTPVLAWARSPTSARAARGTVVAPGLGAAGRARTPVLPQPATLPGPPAEAEDVDTVLADWVR